MDKINIMLIGLGPHSKRIYIPALRKLKNTNIKAVVELLDTKQQTERYLKEIQLEVETIYTQKFAQMGADFEKLLSNTVSEKNISGVIIATEPTVHKPYAKWALNNRLHILMDKPISTYDNIRHDAEISARLLEDYEELKNLYEPAKKRDKCFLINVQRRFHPGFKLVLDEIKKVREQTGCPVSTIQAMHCDGQWRLPEEITTQSYHPYNTGYGKISHSGYHIIDMLAQYIKAGYKESQRPTGMEIYGTAVEPAGLLKQLSREDYIKLFGKQYNKVSRKSDEVLAKEYKKFGEIDTTATFSLKNQNIKFALVTLNLMHNGFSRRYWMTPGIDLYKGNGRVKHEYHNIQQGPFQNIQIHSYQSKDKHDVCTKEDQELGGNNHFDILIFRNSNMLKEAAPLDRITMRDLKHNLGINNSKLFIEEIKHDIVRQFVDFIGKKIRRSELLSELDSHQLGVKMMGGYYTALATQSIKQYCIDNDDFV